MISRGITAYLQTLDIAMNKPFKVYLRMEIKDNIENRMVRNKRGNFVKPRTQYCNLGDKFKEQNHSYIANALRAVYLNKNFSFHEVSIARHKRVGAKILEKIELSKSSAEILEPDDLQDIPEDDHMIVFK